MRLLAIYCIERGGGGDEGSEKRSCAMSFRHCIYDMIGDCLCAGPARQL